MARHDSYAENLEEAKKFEDYVDRKLYHEAGLPIGLHRSGSFQISYGESRAGFEIKYDRKCKTTGRLFIETAETHDVDVPMKPAGIHGKGVFLVIGDYHKIWLFGMRTLRRLESQFTAIEVKKGSQKPTARGFLLPVTVADEYAELVLNGGEPRVMPHQSLETR